MDRKNFLKTTGFSLAAVLTYSFPVSCSSGKKPTLMKFPDSVTARINQQVVDLFRNTGERWEYQNIGVELVPNSDSLEVRVQAPGIELSEITLKWDIPHADSSSILNDHWERTYGDLSWHKHSEDESLPWYFLEHDGKTTNGFGVKTGTNSFCLWRVSDTSMNLVMDLRSGSKGVKLGDRTLTAAEIVAFKGFEEESVFEASKRFMTVMCESPRMPLKPVYGINDWYFSYGDNSDALIMEHTRLMAPMAEGLSNRPFSVIDAGWFGPSPSIPDYSSWGDMSTPNKKFPDMAKLSNKITEAGMRPGIWTRPLCGGVNDPGSLMLSNSSERMPVLDPSIPENIERIQSYFRLYNEWGYELVKFDYTSFDIFKKWGFQMLEAKTMTEGDWGMNDNSKTNAEIILNMYRKIREAAGETYIIGCNTFSHLSAGLFELNRIGDDTSGNEWERTLKMGVNTLAFRGIHHGTFYSADADCVGLTPKVDWAKNKQWMELVAKSGTPLFISAQPEATGNAQKDVIKKCFELASRELPLGEPLNWMDSPTPNKWRLNGETETFDWT